MSHLREQSIAIACALPEIGPIPTNQDPMQLLKSTNAGERSSTMEAAIDDQFKVHSKALLDQAMSLCPLATVRGTLQRVRVTNSVQNNSNIWQEHDAVDPEEGPRAELVEDVSFPAESKVEQHRQFRKVWRVRNTGPSAWPPGVVVSCSTETRTTPDVLSQLKRIGGEGKEYKVWTILWLDH